MICLDRTEPTARIAHTCTWCRTIIPAGSVYERTKWADSGTAWTQKAHTDCLGLLMRYCAYYALGEDDPIEWSEVIEWSALARLETP